MSRLSTSRVMAGYAAVMAALGVVLFAGTGLDAVSWAAIGSCATGAIVWGLHRHRPQRPVTWWALAAGVVMMTCGDVIYGLATDAGGAGTDPPLADACYVAMFPLVAAALIGLTRASKTLQDRSGLLDLLALGSAGLLAGWVFVAGPQVRTAGLDATGWSLQAAYTLGDVVVLVATVRLVTAAWRNIAAVLLAAGAAGLLVADVGYGIAQSHGGLPPGTPADLGYLVLYSAWGAAALSPSMRELTAPPEQRAVPARRAAGNRPVLLVAAAGVPPLVLLYEAVTGPVRDAPVIATVSAITLALLVTRLSDAVHRHADALRREQALRHAGTVLVSVTDTAAVAIAVRAAVRTLLPADAPHVILVDSSLTDLLPLGALTAPRIVPVGDVPPLWLHRLGDFSHVLLCPLDAAVLYIAADPRDLRAVHDAVTVLAGQAALALARIGLTEAASRRDSDDYLRTVAEHTNDVVLVLDDDERIRYTSPSVTDVLGIWPTPFASLREIVSPDDRDQVDVTMAAVLSGGRDGAHDMWSLARPDGSRVLVEVNFRDLRDDRLVRGMVITLRDVTEQRRHAHEALRRSWGSTPAGQNRDNTSRKYT